jgi:hypothetical protein
MAFKAPLVFPSNLYTTGAGYVTFTAYDKDGGSIGHCALYMPPGVSFADGAGYSTFDMGPLGADIAAGISGGLNQDAIKSVLDSATSAANSNSDLRTIMAGKMIQNAAMVPGADRVSDIYQQSKSIAINPNTTTAFQNMNIRSFVFNFKLVPDNQSESTDIKMIQNFFRELMYADTAGQGYLLSYPAKWKIKFKNSLSNENPYYPKIYESYLTNFQTSFNGSGHLHHRDDAPTEVDISLTFQETRVLTQADIRGLL